MQEIIIMMSDFNSYLRRILCSVHLQLYSQFYWLWFIIKSMKSIKKDVNIKKGCILIIQTGFERSDNCRKKCAMSLPS